MSIISKEEYCKMVILSLEEALYKNPRTRSIKPLVPWAGLFDWQLSRQRLGFWTSFNYRLKLLHGKANMQLHEVIDKLLEYLGYDESGKNMLRQMIYGEPDDRYMGIQILRHKFTEYYMTDLISYETAVAR